jgi:hypothetical protein
MIIYPARVCLTILYIYVPVPVHDPSIQYKDGSPILFSVVFSWGVS